MGAKNWTPNSERSLPKEEAMIRSHFILFMQV
jgi:hypothetical protein